MYTYMYTYPPKKKTDSDISLGTARGCLYGKKNVVVFFTKKKNRCGYSTGNCGRRSDAFALASPPRSHFLVSFWLDVRLFLMGCRALLMECRALLLGYRALLMGCRALLMGCRALLMGCRALLMGCRALLMEYRALLMGYRALLMGYMALLMGCRALLMGCRALLLWLPCRAPALWCLFLLLV